MVGFTKLSVLLVTLLSSVCYGQQRVYRADQRSPAEIQRAGGFLPRGVGSVHGIAPNLSMWNHAHGAANGASTDIDGYVSTAADLVTAQRFLDQQFGGTGFVYEIAATPSFIQVGGTLGRFNPFPNEHEYAALGGFRWDQVIGWEQRSHGIYVQTGSGVNRAYNTRYNSMRAHAGEPRLAGFPAGHPAWLENPWAAFGDCQRGGRMMRRQNENTNATLDSGSCKGRLTNVQYAVQYMDEKCAGGSC